MSHPFAAHRAVMIATRRPLSQVLGTETARVMDLSAAHLEGWKVRRAKRRAADPVLREAAHG